MLKRRGLRAFGSEPFCPAMKTPLRSIALKTGDWQLDGSMTVGTEYFDSSQVGHLDVQGRFTHAGSFPCSSAPARTGPATVSFPRQTKHPQRATCDDWHEWRLS